MMISGLNIRPLIIDAKAYEGVLIQNLAKCDCKLLLGIGNTVWLLNVVK